MPLSVARAGLGAMTVESGLMQLVVLAAVGGLLVGSFLNVVAWRLPRGESLMTPGSHCPGCGHPVRPYDNVPVLSWLVLRGRCRDCRTPISVRYPLVEALTAALAAGVVLTNDGLHDVLLGLVLVALLVPIALIDLDHRIIPNRLTALGAVPEQLIAGAAAGGFLLLAALARPGGMGMGDVKLAGMLGLFLGREVAVALLVALIAGTLVGVVVMARRGVGEGRRTAIPFGPFLALGGVVAVLAGPAIVDWYLATFA